MTNQPHVIEIEIDKDGKITGTVKGVAGPSCTSLSAWLDQLGEVTLDEHTADFAKPEKVLTTATRKGV